MARKSVAVGDIIEMDRGKLFSDMSKLKRNMKRVLRKTGEEDEAKEMLEAGIHDIRGKNLLLELKINAASNDC